MTSTGFFSKLTFYMNKTFTCKTRSHNQGRRSQARAISSIGTVPMTWDNFLFLEQIAPSPAAHARTCCEDFCECRPGKMASETHEIYTALWKSSVLRDEFRM